MIDNLTITSLTTFKQQASRMPVIIKGENEGLLPFEARLEQ
jgi:hypothetical protein